MQPLANRHRRVIALEAVHRLECTRQPHRGLRSARLRRSPPAQVQMRKPSLTTMQQKHFALYSGLKGAQEAFDPRGYHNSKYNHEGMSDCVGINRKLPLGKLNPGV